MPEPLTPIEHAKFSIYAIMLSNIVQFLEFCAPLRMVKRAEFHPMEEFSSKLSTAVGALNEQVKGLGLEGEPLKASLAEVQAMAKQFKEATQPQIQDTLFDKIIKKIEELATKISHKLMPLAQKQQAYIRSQQPDQEMKDIDVRGRAAPPG